MKPNEDASQKSWISPHTITWFVSFLLAAFGFWYGTDRRDSDAVTALRERIIAIETRMNEGRQRRDEQVTELRERVRLLETSRR